MFKDIDELKNEIQAFEDNMNQTNGIIGKIKDALNSLNKNEKEIKNTQALIENSVNMFSGLKADFEEKEQENIEKIKELNEILAAQGYFTKTELEKNEENQLEMFSELHGIQNLQEMQGNRLGKIEDKQSEIFSELHRMQKLQETLENGFEKMEGSNLKLFANVQKIEILAGISVALCILTILLQIFM